MLNIFPMLPKSFNGSTTSLVLIRYLFYLHLHHDPNTLFAIIELLGRTRWASGSFSPMIGLMRTCVFRCPVQRRRSTSLEPDAFFSLQLAVQWLLWIALTHSLTGMSFVYSRRHINYTRGLWYSQWRCNILGPFDTSAALITVGRTYTRILLEIFVYCILFYFKNSALNYIYFVTLTTI